MSGSIECRAYRRGRTWVAHVCEYGVYGHGRTLKALRDSIIDGLAHTGGSTDVMVVAVTPELENLRAAEDAYARAMRTAVTALASDSTTLGDIALATGAPATRVKALLADLSEPHINLNRVSPPDRR